MTLRSFPVSLLAEERVSRWTMNTSQFQDNREMNGLRYLLPQTRIQLVLLGITPTSESGPAAQVAMLECLDELLAHYTIWPE